MSSSASIVLVELPASPSDRYTNGCNPEEEICPDCGVLLAHDNGNTVVINQALAGVPGSTGYPVSFSMLPPNPGMLPDTYDVEEHLVAINLPCWRLRHVT